MNIKLHIDRLVLDGLPVTRAQAPLIQAAVEAELVRLLADGGVPHPLLSGGATPFASGGTIHLKSGSDPVHLGTHVARAVYGGLQK